MSDQKKLAERKLNSLSMMEKGGGIAGGLGSKGQRTVGGYGGKKFQSRRIQKTHKHEKIPINLNLKVKKPRVTHLTNDPHRQKKLLRQANLGDDSEDDVLG